jgi:hypothetical protein
MSKWWWFWLPGRHAKWKLEKKNSKLEKCRARALSAITGERLQVELMARRPRREDDVLNDTILEKALKRLAEIEEGAKHAFGKKVLNDLIDDAEKEGQFRAYLCPREEIWVEGCLAIALMEEWGVPKSVISNLREMLGQKLKDAMQDTEAARGALRDVFEESDSWSDYTSDYEEEMKKFTHWWLFTPTVVLTFAAIIAFRFPLTLPFGLLFAGVAGSCVSVMTKMPVLEVTLSGDLDSYGRRILGRIGAGMVGSLVGCGFLVWGLISFSPLGQTFADILNTCSIACSTPFATSCTAQRTLILLAVPMIFGFSERALTLLEQGFFGNSNRSRKGYRNP